MKTKTQDLTGAALDWAVAKCEGTPLVYRGRKWPTDGAATIEYAPWAVHPVVDGSGPYVPALCRSAYNPSTDWSQGGPIIEREKLCLIIGHAGVWLAYSLQNYTDEPTFMVNGPTPLVAAMRAFVSSKLGEEVDIPEGLV